MDFTIASILLLDGVTNGAVYALLAMATVLLFAVTRVIFIPQGEFVAFGALTVGMFQAGQVPGTVWLLLAMAMGPLIYRLGYQSLADASVLVLLIVSVGVHFTLTGLGLLFFGAEG